MHFEVERDPHQISKNTNTLTTLDGEVLKTRVLSLFACIFEAGMDPQSTELVEAQSWPRALRWQHWVHGQSKSNENITVAFLAQF